ncbi:hypothetical protein MLPM_0679 [Mycobacterium lepromatosis]|uniref:Uncharacterized protein n=1 Tax=Mycobacterium lepromatosis TaxID=480418 RepID=A0A0F4ERT1_9MYCO|nr:hypothetical protein MLPM_0679 [Mycobacterium lepromatosis]
MFVLSVPRSSVSKNGSGRTYPKRIRLWGVGVAGQQRQCDLAVVGSQCGHTKPAQAARTGRRGVGGRRYGA